MQSALFAFDDRRAAQRAVDLLLQSGLAPDAVQLHAQEPSSREELANEMDELVTGGMVGNLKGLFDGLFQWGSSPHDPRDYMQAVRAGGAVVRVQAATEADQATADRVMRSETLTRYTGWSDRG